VRTIEEKRRPAPDADEAEAARRKRSPLYALSFRNFRLFFYGQLVSVAGTWMQTIAQNWLIYALTHEAKWLGIVNGASAIPYVLFAVWGGQVADRYSRRTVLIWTQAAAMVLAFALAALAMESNHLLPIQPWHIAVISGLNGVVNAFNMPAQQALVTDLVDDRDAIPNAIALNSLRFNTARFLGPMLAGVVLVKYGAAACFWINGFSFVAVILSLLWIRAPHRGEGEGNLSMWEGFGYIARERRVLRVVALVGAASLLAWSVSTLYPVFADLFQRAEAGYSTIMSVNGVGAALGGLAVTVIGTRVSARYLVYGGAFCFAATLLLLTWAPSFGLFLFWLGISGFAMIVFAISANTFVQQQVPDELRGRVMGVYSLIFGGLLPVGGLAIGYLSDRIGARPASSWEVSAFLAIAVALFLWSQLDRRRMEA
jgi:MFS family permease